MSFIENHTTDGTPYCDDAKLRARDVCVYYGEKQAIQNVSLDIGANEVIAVSYTHLTLPTKRIV